MTDSGELTAASSPASSGSLSGAVVAQFEIQGRIGAGGFGEVYRAKDTRLGRTVAVKVLPDTFAKDPERRERFRREAVAASALNHPNICTVHDLVEADGKYLIVMELVEGKTLQAALKDGPLPLEKLLPIALQVTEALGEAHRAGILHRDIKPGNIAITPRGQVKVLDFGLAKLVGTGNEESGSTVDRLTEEGSVFGTLSYMSPEQLLGRPLDARSDLFSLGVVLYEMATARLPFQGTSKIAVADAILHAEPRVFSDRSIPETLKPVVQKLLQKEPAKRYTSAGEVCREVKALQGSFSGRKAGLSVAAWGGLAAAGLIVAALAGWSWHRASRQRWALEQIPEIERLVEAGEFTRAAALITQARAILPGAPSIEKLWKGATTEVSVESTPPGAKVSYRPYRGDPDAWKVLGETPVRKVRIPRDYYLWQIGKQGYAPATRIGPLRLTHDRLLEFSCPLEPEAKVPLEMVQVPSEDFAAWLPGFFGAEVKIESFLIDRHEVTNAQYRKFVDAGGYQGREFWKEPFVEEGRSVPWTTAMTRFQDATGRPGPATWEAGSYPKGREGHPVAGISWYEAVAYANFVGKSLPTAYHWYLAAQREAAMLIVPGSNFRGEGTVPVGSPGAIGGFGTTDMAGNVKEWCWNEGGRGRRLLVGGGFGEPTYFFTESDAQSPWDRRPNYGFRCVRLSSPPPAAALAKIEPDSRDFSRETPVSDELFQSFKRLYTYEKGPLNARTVETETSEDWTREKVVFDAAYGGEQVPAHLYLPRNAKPPYQAVVYFPGSGSQFEDKFDTAYFYGNDFIPKGGRALLFPIYKGTYERRLKDEPGTSRPAAGVQRDRALQLAQDVSRSVDYLETRSDIDSSKLAYQGFSWGSARAPISLAVEGRFRTAILAAGGFYQGVPAPEMDAFNFAGHVRIPVLMINGRYDTPFPVLTSQVPLFRQLGTPEKDKRHIIYETGHVPPNREAIRESLDWLDRYLGPVKRP